jgi:anaerobic selenocysteine-containing dehydrogenase
MQRWHINAGDRVVVSTDTGSMEAVAYAFDITAGNAAMYFPECNTIVPRDVDPSSRTPAFKGFVASVQGV